MLGLVLSFSGKIPAAAAKATGARGHQPSHIRAASSNGSGRGGFKTGGNFPCGGPTCFETLFSCLCRIGLLLHLPQRTPFEPPTRAARLSFLYGSVSFQPAGESDWVGAELNRPLTSGDSLWADAGARAELRVGSTAMRIDQSTGVTLLEVGDRVLQMRVAQGSVILSARHLEDDDIVEADTPNLAFSVLAPGEYRLDVNADGTATSASVWRGKGLVNGGGR